jgi:hypothetical protein
MLPVTAVHRTLTVCGVIIIFVVVVAADKRRKLTGNPGVLRLRDREQLKQEMSL